MAGRPTEAPDWPALLAGAPEGERHVVATRIAGRCLGKGLAPAEVEEILIGYSVRCTPPLPVAEDAYRRAITLPLDPRMSDRDLEDVCAAVRKVVAHYRR